MISVIDINSCDWIELFSMCVAVCVCVHSNTVVPPKAFHWTYSLTEPELSRVAPPLQRRKCVCVCARECDHSRGECCRSVRAAV